MIIEYLKKSKNTRGIKMSVLKKIKSMFSKKKKEDKCCCEEHKKAKKGKAKPKKKKAKK